MNTSARRCLTTLALAGVVSVGSSAWAQPNAQPQSPAKREDAKPPQPAPSKDKPANPAPATDAKPAEAVKPADPTKPAGPATGTDGDKKNTKPAENTVSTYVLDHKVKTIDGKEVELSQYKGKVLVIVNVASQCGFTAQYEGLQELYDAKKDQGLVVLGFPANDYGQQEPGTEEEIKTFCESFKVTFPMFSKVTVKGENKHPLYAELAAQEKPIGGEPRWNFTKFVVDQKGNVVARFDAEKAYVRSSRLEPGLVAKVDELLAAKK
jgi:glutathione peroxidase